MPFAPMNVMLDQALPQKGSLSLPYPGGRNEGHFFGGVNHTLSVDGVFFRSPRDFTLFAHSDRITFTWNGSFTLPAGTLLNIQAEIPGGDYYFDPKIGVTVLNMVHSPLFMVNMAAPAAENDRYWVEAVGVDGTRPIKLANTQVASSRNVVVTMGNESATFTIEGEDLYQRTMIEKISAIPGVTEGKKAFTKIHRITSNHPCTGHVLIGTGNKLGLPVFLPLAGYLIREIINGTAIIGGTVVAGETASPTATTGDRRGTYSPPSNLSPDGKRNIHLLLSLLAPGNIGIPDYAG